MRFTKQQGDGLIFGLIIAIIFALFALFNPDSDSHDANWYFESGKDLDLRHEEERALPYYNEAIRLNPNYAEAYAWRCGVLRNLDRFGESLDDCNRSINLNPQSSNAYSQRCLSYRSLEKYDLAMLDCNHSIELSPTNAGNYNNRGLLYVRLGEEELAMADYNRSIELDPTDEIVFYNRGRSYLRSDNVEAAIADFEESIRLDTEYWRPYSELVDSYYELGNIDLAYETANRMLEHLPEHPQTFEVRGDLFLRDGQMMKAVQSYEHVIELDVDYTDVYLSLAYIYLSKERNEDALSYFCQYMEIADEDTTMTQFTIDYLGGCPELEATAEATEAP